MIAEAKKTGVQEVVNKSDTAGRMIGVIEELLKQRPEESGTLTEHLTRTGLTRL
jgi:hypothetical protein